MRVHAGGGLVQEQDARLRSQRPRDVDTLALPTGDFIDRAFAQFKHARLAQGFLHVLAVLAVQAQAGKTGLDASHTDHIPDVDRKGFIADLQLWNIANMLSAFLGASSHDAHAAAARRH